MIVGDSTRPHKKTLDESRLSSNSNFISTNFDLSNKRQKRIGKHRRTSVDARSETISFLPCRLASPQSTLSLPSSGPLTSSSPHDILTPSWRMLTEHELNICPTDEKSGDVQENEDISDEVFIRRHIRCELEQESWAMNTSAGAGVAATPTAATTSTNSLALSSNRRSSTLQTSLSLPSSLSSTNSKQYRDRLTPNGGVTYTETIDTK